MLNYSRTEENYIKAIYHLEAGKDSVSTNDLAESLQTKPASITDMLKKLKKKKLVSYQAYYGCRLTLEGKQLALMIIRRHRLWEYFLSQKLDFSWDEVHDVAEELEHVSSEKLINKLDAYLGFPRFDPHGDPIPDEKGAIANDKLISLNNQPENKPCIVSKIGNQSVSILEMLEQKNIVIKTRLEIIKKYPFDGSMEVKVGRSRTTILTKELAHNIFIKEV
ncbi:MAG TPA: metal-dependent transcriptional regulator [Niabella sp.]|jgi:DtxR family Mn-dependent transcriptional regulator|nr:metal-dependent transcriptional regulator [Niabella sp.]HRO83875.1 metal-dependent transcriptional regulator [Niabella sp.]HUN04755.1 metal-dependent transcriptional regulator [Niabella sp.]